MVSDYHIVKCLYIYFNSINYIKIELYKDKKYFYFDFSQEEDYKKKKLEYIKNILISPFLPMLLYEKDHFIHFFNERKYKEVINIYLIKNRKTWKDIIKIILTEERIKT